MKYSLRQSLHHIQSSRHPDSGFWPSGEGFFRLSAFGHRKNAIEAVEMIKMNFK